MSDTDQGTANKPQIVKPFAAQGTLIEGGPAAQGNMPGTLARDPDPIELDPAQEPETAPTVERLAAAEDKLLGPDVPRHDGQPEMGAGSKYAALHPAHKAHLAAIRHLISVEHEHAKAEVHLASVHARLEHAKERVDSTEEASNAVGEKA